MAVIMGDFDTSGGRDFEALRPIGVWLTQADGGISLRYRPEVEDGEDVGHDNYLRTLRSLEDPVDQWRAGKALPDFAELLVRVSDSSYLGLTFRTIGIVDDAMSIDEAFERFVIAEEPLPPSEELDDYWP